VPLWETQLAQALTIQRSSEAAEAVRDANDLTNELLKANADNTINESLQIADEGKRKRAEAEDKLAQMEAELRDTLSAAKGSSPA